MSYTAWRSAKDLQEPELVLCRRQPGIPCERRNGLQRSVHNLRHIIDRYVKAVVSGSVPEIALAPAADGDNGFRPCKLCFLEPFMGRPEGQFLVGLAHARLAPSHAAVLSVSLYPPVFRSPASAFAYRLVTMPQIGKVV